MTGVTQAPVRGEVLRTTNAAGLVSLAAGALLAVDAAAHLAVDDTYQPAELAGLAHELWHVPGIVGVLLAMFALIGIHERQSDVVGRSGRAGFVLLFTGVALGAAYSTLFHGFFLPAVERLEPGLFEMLATSTTTAQNLRGVVVQAFGLGLGAILYGGATIRAGRLPAIGGWMLIGAALLAGANQAFDAAQLLSRFLFAAAFVGLGLGLLGMIGPNSAR